MKNLEFEIENCVGLLRINRPNALNALNLELLGEMKLFLETEIQKNVLKALILTGSGDKAFIAGADIKEMQSLDAAGIETFITLGQQVTLLLENAPFITIAAVNGFALGGGLEMALACDFIYASEKAKLGLPEVTLGIIPGFGGTQRLARAVGTRRAIEMIATGKHLEAEEAKEIGLVNHVYKAESLIGACWSTADRIARHSHTALAQGKSAVIEGIAMPLPAALDLEKAKFVHCFSTPEREGAMQAFLDKTTRKANAG